MWGNSFFISLDEALLYALINLDNSEKTLTLAEIINQASPSELNDFLLGVNRPETQEFDYMKALMSPNETLVGNMVEIATTIDAITNINAIVCKN